MWDAPLGAAGVVPEPVGWPRIISHFLHLFQANTEYARFGTKKKEGGGGSRDVKSERRREKQKEVSFRKKRERETGQSHKAGPGRTVDMTSPNFEMLRTKVSTD